MFNLLLSLLQDILKEIAKYVDIPIIANGGSRDIEKYADILKFRNACGVDSVMIARAAQWNVSIFRKDGKIQINYGTEKTKLTIHYRYASFG